jgi:hypothetical protein
MLRVATTLVVAVGSGGPVTVLVAHSVTEVDGDCEERTVPLADARPEAVAEPLIVGIEADGSALVDCTPLAVDESEVSVLADGDVLAVAQPLSV